MGVFRYPVSVVAAAGLAALTGCSTAGVETVEQMDLMLDCYFLPIDRPAISAANPAVSSAECSEDRIGQIAALSGAVGSRLVETSKSSERYGASLKLWETSRTQITADLADAYKLRVLRGYYIYAYLAKLSADEALNNANDAKTTAARIITPLRRGIGTLDEISAEVGIWNTSKNPAAALGHTFKADAFFDGFEATYEARAATYTRAYKWLRGLTDIVNVADVADRVREGAKFAYSEIKVRAFASALQFDLIDAANHVAHKPDRTVGFVDAHYDARLAGIRAYINEQCKRLGVTAGLPEADHECSKDRPGT